MFPIARAISGQIHRSSAMPFCLPAPLTGWHGNPMATTSAAGTLAQSTLVMSPWLTMCG